MLGSRDSNPKFHVQSVTCCRYTTPQSDGYFTTKYKNRSNEAPVSGVTIFFATSNLVKPENRGAGLAARTPILGDLLGIDLRFVKY